MCIQQIINMMPRCDKYVEIAEDKHTKGKAYKSYYIFKDENKAM